MLDNFTLQIRTRIVFGEGKVNEVAKIAKAFKGKRVMIVADKGVQKTGIVDRVTESLEQARYAVSHFDEIVPNPQSYDCERGAKIAIDKKIDLLVAIGGGSSMDTAKAIAAMAGHGTTDFSEIAYPKSYTCPPLPLICIATTAGTGSEVTTCGVITNSQTHKKEYCYDKLCAPDVAIADPQLLMSLPKDLAAITGIDALTHAIEGYVVKCANPITAAMGFAAIRLIYKNIREYVYNRTMENASAMMMGSLMAGIAFGYADTGCVHTLSETLSKYYNTSHGLANAVFLSEVTKYSIPADMERYDDVAEAMGVYDRNLTVGERVARIPVLLQSLITDLEIPSLKELEYVNTDDFESIAADCLEHISVGSNPRLMEKEDFIKILNMAYAK